MMYGQNTMMGSGYNPMGRLYPQSPYYPQYQPQPQADEIQGVRFVNGKEGAQACMLPFGSRALLMDENNPRFFIKEVDGNGVVNMKEYVFEEVVQPVEQPAQYVTREEFAQVMSENYVPRQEYDQLKEQYESLISKEPAKPANEQPDSGKADGWL